MFSSSNTGSTDLRLTEVQQPNTAATLFWAISSRAFSANSGQFEAGSTTTASIFLPSRPPFLFCSSISISMTSFSVVSLIAMVPDSECRMPTLMVSSARAAPTPRDRDASSETAPSMLRLVNDMTMPPAIGWLRPAMGNRRATWPIAPRGAAKRRSSCDANRSARLRAPATPAASRPI